MQIAMTSIRDGQNTPPSGHQQPDTTPIGEDGGPNRFNLSGSTDDE